MAVAVVLEQHVAFADRGDEEVLVAVVVDVGERRGDADPVGQRDAGLLRDVRKPAARVDIDYGGHGLSKRPHGSADLAPCSSHFLRSGEQGSLLRKPRELYVRIPIEPPVHGTEHFIVLDVTTALIACCHDSYCKPSSRLALAVNRASPLMMTATSSRTSKTTSTTPPPR